MEKTYEVGTLFAVKEKGIGYDFVAEVTEIIHATSKGHTVVAIHYKVIHGEHPSETTDSFDFHVGSMFEDFVVLLPNTAKVLYD